MDDIKAKFTNLHKIEGILFVQWATYAEPEQDDSDASSKVQQQIGSLLLDKAEHDLLKAGQYVVQASDQSLIWHFILSGPSVVKDARAIERGEQAGEILANYRLKRTSSGSLRRADIVDAASTQVNGGEDERSKGVAPLTPIANNIAFQHNSSVDISLPDQPPTRESSPSLLNQDNLLIYTKIREAITNLITYILVSDGRYIPLSSAVLVTRRSLVAHDCEMVADRDNDDDISTWSSCFSLKAAWLPDGTVFILSHPTSVLAVWPTSRQDLQVLLTKNFRPVILAPTGLIASIIGHQVGLSKEAVSSLNGKSLAFEHVWWQHLLREWLGRRAISLLQDELWVWVRVQKFEAQPFDFVDSIPKTPILWPRELCYDITELNKGQTRVETQILDDLVATDALSDAEAWFVSRESRTEAIKAQRLEQQQKEIPAARPVPSDDDILAEMLSHHETTLEAQAASGIYPTPPEGTRAPGFQSTEERVSSHQNDDGDHASLNEDKDGIDANEEPPTLTDINMTNPDFDELGEDDLFSNLEGNMYADNGITEDDFSFFDDPGQSALERSAISANPVKPEPTLQSMETSSSPLEEPYDNELMISPVGDSATDVKALENSSPMDIVPRAPGDTSPANGSEAVGDFARGANHEGSDGDPNSHLGSLYPLSPINNAKFSSFVEKYGKAGKFAIATENQPSTLKPWSRPDIENAIPILEASGSQESSDLEDDELPSNFQESAGNSDDDENNVESPPDSVNLQHSIGSPQSIRTSLPSPDTEFFYSRHAHNAIAPSPEHLLLSIQRLELANTKSAIKRRQAGEIDHAQPPSEDMVAYIRLFQLVADQLVHYRNLDEMDAYTDDTQILKDSQTRRFNDPMVDTIDACFPRLVQCTLESWVNIGDDAAQAVPPNNKPAGRLPLKRQDTSKTGIDPRTQASSCFPLGMPNMRAKRGAKQMEMSYMALQFWEELGLSPFTGPKNIISFCVYPDHESTRRGAASFLSLMGSTYTSLRLGLHTLGHASMKEYQDGLVPFPTLNGQSHSPYAKNACERLGKALLPLSSLKRTIVIYMVNDSLHKTAIKNICAHFITIFDNYASLVRHVSQPSDLVLKVLPLKWITSPAAVPVPSVSDLIQLSKEIYDRCPADDSASSPYASHSFTEIAAPIPKSVEFKVSSDARAGPFQSESFAHLGYCWNEGSPWLTTALIDNLGCHTWMASFYIGQPGDPLPIFQAVAREMLEVAREAIEEAHGKPRIVVVKDDQMSVGELAAWTALAGEQEATPLAIVILDKCPPLYLCEESLESCQVDLNQISTSVPGTPDIISPEVNSPRFPEDVEPSARLASLAEETWAVTSTRQLVIEGNELDTRPSISSGYLVKNRMATLGIRILHSDNEVDAANLLKTYHGLTLLSQAKGFPEEVPWHVAVARRAHSGLSVFH